MRSPLYFSANFQSFNATILDIKSPTPDCFNIRGELLIISKSIKIAVAGSQPQLFVIPVLSFRTAIGDAIPS